MCTHAAVPVFNLIGAHCLLYSAAKAERKITILLSCDLMQVSRSALERYLFYCNRYVNHLKSLKMEHKLYDMAHQKMCELQQLSMSWIEVF